MLAELHRQKRRDRMGPIGQSDSSRQAAILRDISRTRNSTGTPVPLAIARFDVEAQLSSNPSAR
jgi:hypothetical protein